MEREFDKEEEIKKIDEKIKDAEENLGNEEVRDAIIEKAELYLKAGNKQAAIETFDKALKLSVGVSKKMEIEFQILLIYIKEKNLEKIKEHIDIQHKFLLDGGDWEKKNKLKVYEGIYNLMVREFSKASSLLLDCTATFTSSEVISFN
jgi:26S proteasome regulatory subunit N7